MKLTEIVAASKQLSGTQSWLLREPNQLCLVSALEADGVTMEAVQLRMRALQDEPDRAVMIQLEYNPPRGRNERLIRVEWRPLTSHTNDNRAPEPYRLMIIRTSHMHRFEHNYNEAGDRMVRGNLPRAIPLEPDPANFGELLEVASKELKISDLSRVTVPPWQARMV